MNRKITLYYLRFKRFLSSANKGRKTLRKDAKATVELLLHDYSKEECVTIVKFMNKELYMIINKDIEIYNEKLALAINLKKVLEETDLS